MRRFFPVTTVLGCTALLCSVACLAAGQADETFGEAGRRLVTLGASAQAFAVTVEAAGAVSMAGAVQTNGRDIAVVKLTSDGDLDETFGIEGKLVVDLGGTDVAHALLHDPLGHLYVGGETTVAGSQAFVVLKYTQAGEPVDDFGDGGKVVIDIGTSTDDVVRTLLFAPASGDVLVVGSQAPAGTTALEMRRAAVARIDATGALVSKYGDGGLVVVDELPMRVTAEAAVVDDAGRLYIGPGNGAYKGRIVRLLSDGVVDGSFGLNGAATVEVPHYAGTNLTMAGALARDGEDRLLLAGNVRNAYGADASSVLFLARLTSNGQLDAGFAPGGSMTLSTLLQRPYVNDLLMDRSGVAQLIGAGSSGANHDIVLAQIDEHGLPLQGFGVAGVQVFDFGTFDVAFAGAYDASGRLVVAGNAPAPNGRTSMLAMRVVADALTVHGDGFESPRAATARPTPSR